MAACRRPLRDKLPQSKRRRSARRRASDSATRRACSDKPTNEQRADDCTTPWAPQQDSATTTRRIEPQLPRATPDRRISGSKWAAQLRTRLAGCSTLRRPIRPREDRCPHPLARCHPQPVRRLHGDRSRRWLALQRAWLRRRIRCLLLLLMLLLLLRATPPESALRSTPSDRRDRHCRDGLDPDQLQHPHRARLGPRLRDRGPWSSSNPLGLPLRPAVAWCPTPRAWACSRLTLHCLANRVSIAT